MAGYRRFIAYVYEYSRGRKGNGKGFIKVESRNGICRMNYKMEGASNRENLPAKIFGYVREGEMYRGTLLGNCDLGGDSVQFDLELQEENMGGSGYGLSQLSGIVILTALGDIYGSAWDEAPLDPNRISFEEPEKKEEEFKEEEAFEEEPEENRNEEEKEQEEREAPEEEKIEFLEKEDRRGEEEEERKETTTYEVKRERFDPFGDGLISDCRKISLSDCHYISRKDQGLMNNRFLRHGFYNYGHLLLGKREDDGRFILGVPGIYERQEKSMAGMFGFPYFKKASGKVEEKGRFGYWYRLIDAADTDAMGGE